MRILKIRIGEFGFQEIELFSLKLYILLPDDRTSGPVSKLHENVNFPFTQELFANVSNQEPAHQLFQQIFGTFSISPKITHPANFLGHALNCSKLNNSNNPSLRIPSPLKPL